MPSARADRAARRGPPRPATAGRRAPRRGAARRACAGGLRQADRAPRPGPAGRRRAARRAGRRPRAGWLTSPPSPRKARHAAAPDLPVALLADRRRRAAALVELTADPAGAGDQRRRWSTRAAAFAGRAAATGTRRGSPGRCPPAGCCVPCCSTPALRRDLATAARRCSPGTRAGSPARPTPTAGSPARRRSPARQRRGRRRALRGARPAAGGPPAARPSTWCSPAGCGASPRTLLTGGYAHPWPSTLDAAG